MSVLNNATNANLTTSYYALAGESAKNWYQFPSLNGQVLLVDASGTQVLQSIDGDLFYNNELLAKSGDIENIADWSLYPAVATVELAGQNITQVGDISGATAHIGSITATSVTASTISATGITGTTVTASGLVSAGSVSATGNVQGASLTTTGGLDMTNSAITRASAVNISNQGVAPYGALTSPDGVMLTWNGAEVKTGASGNVAQWATFPAVQDVGLAAYNINNVGTINAGTGNITTGNIGTMSMTSNTIQGGNATPLAVASGTGQNLSITSQGNLTESTPNGLMSRTAYTSITDEAGTNINLTVDRGINPFGSAGINLLAKNGNGGVVNVTADPGSVAAFGGQINLTANGGTITIPQPPPDLPISVTVGGEVNIIANTGAGGLYTLTSAINLVAAGINSYAGAVPPVGSLAGYQFIYGTSGVSLCAGLPASGFQFPFTTYIYGVGIPGVAGGVRLQSPTGIQLLSDTYIENIYPLDGNGLTIQGRSLPSASVTIKDLQQLTMNVATALQTDRITSVSNLGVLFQDDIQATAIKSPVPASVGASNLVISGNSNALGNTNYVALQNVTTMAFDAAGAGAITGLQTINGAPYVASDTNQWATYPAVQNVDISGFDLTNVGQINGAPYPPPAGDVATWATFPAVQNVDISGYAVTNVANINVLDNATIVSAGALGIFSDLSGDLSIAAAGGGNVNIGNGGLGNINIIAVDQTTTLSGKIVNITAAEGITVTDPSGVTIIAPFLDLRGADLVDVVNINGDAGVAVTINSSLDIGLEAANDVYIEAQAGTAYLNGTTNVNINSSAGNINLNTTAEVTIPTGQLNMNLNKIVNVAPGSNPDDATNYTQLTFRDATEFYVSAQGSDTSGNGSILAPFRTIQTAITAAELISSASSICNISVASGNYTESLLFQKGYVTLTGTLQSQTGNETCEITGSITIACAGANDVFNRQVTFQGFNLTMGSTQFISDTSTASHTVSLQDCKCFSNSVFFSSTSSAPDMRLFMTNVEVNQSNAAFTGACITTNVGLVEFERLDLNLTGNASGIVIGGTSVLNRCSLSTFDAGSTAAILRPLLQINSSSTSTHTLGNVAFAFSSVVAKTNTNAFYINSSVNTAIIMLNCVFTLGGTANSTNNCVGYNGVGSPTIAGVNNTSLSVNVLLPQTVSVQSGITQISYIDINPPGLACYSSTADQAIAVSGTPQALTFNTTQFNSGTTLLANSRVYANAQGNYALSYSVELLHSGIGVAQTATIFLKKNGTTIANTGRQWSIASGSTQIAAAAEFVVALNSGDYVELFFNGDTSLSANATAAAGALPAIPSVVFNIKQFR
jgi:hypothetical protein